MIELMTVVAILALILGFAVPALYDLMQRNRLVSQTNDIVTDLKLARTTSLITGLPTTICASEDGSTCGGTSWNNGWIVFYDCNASGQVNAGTNVCPTIEGANQIPEQVIKVQSGVNDNTSVNEVQHSGSARKIRFDDVGLLLSPLKDHILRVCADGLSESRVITVNQAGRTAITTEPDTC